MYFLSCACILHCVFSINNVFIIIDGKPLPVTGDDQDFIYLGKHYNFTMTNDSVNIELKEKLTNLISKIADLQIKPYLKLKILSLFIYPKISFELKIYELSTA